jgi:aminoglycoside phosphotransferase (APT) family kinase protein
MNNDERDRLADWLRAHVADFRGSVRLQPLAGGQSNPTYRVEAGDHRWVLRRKPPGVLLASAHAVDREYRVMAALADTDVPVPRVHALCEDPAVIGSTFVVMDHVEGRVFADPSLPELPRAERAAVYDAMAGTLAAIHRVDVAAAGLSDHGRPQRYLSRQIDRWTRQYRASQTGTLEAMERLIDWLPAHLPAGLDDHPGALVHGDYRLDNLIIHPTEPRVLAVIDWELSTLGHPLADLAYHLMAWRVTPEEFRGLKGHDLAALGIPDEAAHVASYRAHGGSSVDGVPGAAAPGEVMDYLMAFNMFRMASILQGIMARARQGNAAAADAYATGTRARLMAEAGWRQARRHG